MEKLVLTRQRRRPCVTEETNLSLVVVFTTVPATKEALLYAVELARDLNARVQLVIPHVVPYPLPLDRPSKDPRATARQFLDDNYGLARVDILLCRDPERSLLEELPGESLVVFGCTSFWRSIRLKRMARALRRAGHQVFLPSLVLSHTSHPR